MKLMSGIATFLSYNDGKIGVGVEAVNSESAKVPSNFSIFVIAFFMRYQI
jgi:hypothetical protein